MKKDELQRLLKNAHVEIKTLRQQNGIMSARLEMFDMVKSMLKTDLNEPQYGMTHPDVLYELEKTSDSLNGEGLIFEKEQ